jgi:hypothetical protein
VACQASNGDGFVRGQFLVEECTTGEEGRFTEYEYVPTDYRTRRFENVLFVSLQDDAVTPIESDVLDIRIPDLALLKSMPRRPLRLPTVLDQAGINVTLSLYKTCPRTPQLRALSGEVVFEVFQVADDPEDTGVQENIRGTLTATVVGVDATRPAGTIEAAFSFVPSSRAPDQAF